MKSITRKTPRKSNNNYVHDKMVLPIFSRSWCCFDGSSGSTIMSTSRYLLASCTLLVLTMVFIGHRFASYRVNHYDLYKNPLNDVVRDCPKPEYDALTSIWTAEEKNGMTTNYHDNDKNHPRICMTTLTDSAKADVIQKLVRWRNFDSLLDMTWPNKQSYCDKHGYILYNESMVLDPSRPPSWSKIRAVRRLLTEEKCDWVFWLDADTVIMNSQKRIEDFLPLPDSSVDLIITIQKHKNWNAGAWLIRNTPWSIEFLDTWWNKREFIQPKGLSVSGDNAALVDYLNGLNESYFREHIHVPPRCHFNSVAKFVTKQEWETLSLPENLKKDPYYKGSDRYHKSDLVAHVAGIDNKITTTALLLKDAM